MPESSNIWRRKIAGTVRNILEKGKGKNAGIIECEVVKSVL